MRYLYILIAMILCLLLVQCKTRQVNKDLKHAMDFLSKKAKEQAQFEEIEELKNKIDSGQKLYKAHCASCHGIFTAGKQGIPNFSKEQIDDYGVAFIRQDPKNHAVALKLSSEQMNKILTFLHMERLSKQIQLIDSKE